jgi:hypothetical protein
MTTQETGDVMKEGMFEVQRKCKAIPKFQINLQGGKVSE